MKRNRLLSRLVALMSVCLLVAVTVRFVVHVSAQTCTTCTNPPQLGRQDTWPQNTLVTVNISGSFTPEQIGCIEQAFTNWSNAGTHAGVVYQFTTNSQPASGSNAIQIWRETPPLTPTGDQPQADTSSYYNSGNTNLDHAVMRVHPGVTNCTALQEAVAHEIGHTYGLDDCPTCCDGTSVMTGYNSLNDIHSGMVSPSSCDVNTATQAGQYNPATENPPSTGGGGGGGGGDGGGGGGGGGGGCTDYWWVEYSCSEELGRMRRQGDFLNGSHRTVALRNHPLLTPEYSCVETSRWYAGCW